MSSNCNCLGVATAAKVPVKRYNLLVPALFPVTEPNPRKPLGIATEKNIKRLAEYLERNEHRIPKARPLSHPAHPSPAPLTPFPPPPQVSRRLARRMHSDLSHNRLGYVHIAVAAYQQLIADDNGRFARLYVNELIIRYPAKKRHLWSLTSRPAASRLPPTSAHLGSVVGALLSAPAPQAQEWGLQLLVSLLKQQHSAEFIDAFESMVPLLCAKAVGAAESAAAAASEDGVFIAGLALQALLEHLRLCFRLSYVSLHLDTITYAVLTIVEAEKPTADGPAVRSAAAAAEAAGVSPLALAKQSIGARVGGSTPGLAALLVYEELGRMTRDAAEGKKVVEFLFRYLDQRPDRWLGGPAMAVGLGVMRDACGQEHQKYLLAAALLAHAGSGGAGQLGPRQRRAVLEEAMKDSVGLERATAPSALLLALQELPAAIEGPAAATAGDPEQESLRKAVFDSIAALAGRVGTRLQLTSVLGAALSRLGGPDTPAATGALECCAAAAAAYDGLESSAPVTRSPHLPNVLLRATLGVCIAWHPRQRALAHTILQRALKNVPQGAYASQIDMLVSAFWYEAALVDNGPGAFAAIDATAAAVLAAATAAEDQARVCRLALALQERTAGEGAASLAQQWAMAAMAGSLLARLAARQRCSSALEDAAALVRAGSGLPSLRLGPKGLEALSPAFTPADDAAAAQALSQFADTAPENAAKRVAAAAAAVPAFRALPSGALGPGFTPLPRSSIVPNITLAAHEAEGLPPSPRAARLRAAFASPFATTTAATDHDGASSSGVGTAVSDRAVAGSRVSRDYSAMGGGAESESGSAGDVGLEASGLSSPPRSLAEVLAGVEASLASVASV